MISNQAYGLFRLDPKVSEKYLRFGVGLIATMLIEITGAVAALGDTLFPQRFAALVSDGRTSFLSSRSSSFSTGTSPLVAVIAGRAHLAGYRSVLTPM